MSIEKDDTLTSTFWDILVLALLGVGKVVVLFEHVSCVVGPVLNASALDDTNTTTGNISESEMEASEFRTNNKEHSVERCLVLLLWKQLGSRLKPVAQRNLCWSVEVGLQYTLVEAEEVVHDLLLMVWCVLRTTGLLANESLELLGIHQLVNLQALETEGWNKLGLVLLVHNVVLVCKSKIQSMDKVWLIVDDLEDVFGSESLITQTLSKIVESSLTNWVVGVDEILELVVFST